MSIMTISLTRHSGTLLAGIQFYDLTTTFWMPDQVRHDESIAIRFMLLLFRQKLNSES